MASPVLSFRVEESLAEQLDRLAAAADLRRGRRQLARDLGLALGERGDHRAVFGERGGVAVGVFQHHGRDDRFKAVALRGVACNESQRL